MKNIESADILILGNGFDLHHNLDTSYKKFIENYPGQSKHFKYLESVSHSLNWIDVEEELSILYNTIPAILDKILEDTDVIMRSKGYHKKAKTNHSSSNLRTLINTRNGLEIYKFICAILSDEFLDTRSGKTIWMRNNYEEKIYESIYRDFLMLSSELSEYLKKVQDSFNEGLIFSDFREKFKTVKRVYNYNYTSTITYYVEDEVPIHYIHGNLEDDIVLGIPYDSTPDKLKPISKEVQVVSKNLTLKEADLPRITELVSDGNGFDFFEKTETIYIMGHSLGTTDWHTLRRLLNSIKNKKIYIFFHDRSSKDSLIINLREMLGEKEFNSTIETEETVFIKYPTR